jgi:hypothetical protein
MHPEVSGLVPCRRYNTPLTRAADGDWLAAQFRIVPLLHAGLKGIEIHMHDAALRLWLAGLLSRARCQDIAGLILIVT